MRCFSTLLSVVLATGLLACSKPHTTTLGEPVTVQVPAGTNIAGPRFSTGSDDQLALSWMVRDSAGTTLRYSRLAGREFAQAHDVITDTRMFVNWADLPSVMSLGGDHWIAHWLRYSAHETYSYDVVVSQSFDDGMTWGEGMPAHTDGTPTEHGFVSMVPQEGGVTLLWLDGRNTPDASMTLRSAAITPDGQRIREQEVDASVCDCCQTDIALAASGPVAVYRDRSSKEVRDIYVTRLLDGQWTKGTRLYADDWTIAGCPVNGPSVVAKDDQVTVTWFSAADDKPVVRVMRSSDGGATFAEPVEIASGRISGYVGLAALDDDSVAVSWVAKDDSGNNGLRLRLVSGAGEPGPVLNVGQTSQLRVFPQLAYSGGDLYLVWTDEVNGSRQMNAVRIPVTVSRHNRSS